MHLLYTLAAGVICVMILAVITILVNTPPQSPRAERKGDSNGRP
jgi:hypothetical protein